MHNISTKTWAVLILLIVFLFFANISLGSVHIPANAVWAILTGGKVEHEAWRYILLEFRIPKALTAIFVGMGLSVSGLQMQTLFRNPLAGPFVLGISSGASLGVALLVMAGGLSAYSGSLGSWMQVTAATLGASLVLFLVLGVSAKVKDSMALLIVGLMLGSATGALVSVLQFFSNKEQLQEYLIWTFGNLGGQTWVELGIFIPLVFFGLLLSFVLTKPLNALLLGEQYAQSMGLHIGRSRFWIIVSTSILAGCITAFCGPIAFVGIAVPHIARLMFNTSDHRVLVPAVSLTGALLMLFCDLLAQLPSAHYTLPINIITSLLGAPVVIWVILRGKNISNSF